MGYKDSKQVPVHVYLSPEAHQRCLDVRAQIGVSISNIVRQGVDKVLPQFEEAAKLASGIK